MKRTPLSPEGRRNRHPYLPNLSFCQGLANTGLPNPQLQLSEGNKGYGKFNKRLGGKTSSGHFSNGWVFGGCVTNSLNLLTFE